VCNANDICGAGDDNVDTDGDLIPDACDMCPIDPQNDSDNDGVCGNSDGDDACPGFDDTVDTDNDGIAN